MTNNRLWEIDKQFEKAKPMTDHWLNDMLPGHNQHLKETFGPNEMPQRHPPIETNVEPLIWGIDYGIEHPPMQYAEPTYEVKNDPYDRTLHNMPRKLLVTQEGLEADFKNGGIQVFSGGPAWPLNLNEDDINIEDIAHALSMKVRFTGHCTKQYSIAQHCCHVHDLVLGEDRKEGLMHDASEYVLPDVAAPLKHSPEFGEWFKPIEHKVEQAIAKRFNLRFPYPPSIKVADNAIVLFERQKIMKPAKYPWMVWTVPGEPAHIPNFEIWPWRIAKLEFLHRAHILGIV